MTQRTKLSHIGLSPRSLAAIVASCALVVLLFLSQYYLSFLSASVLFLNDTDVNGELVRIVSLDHGQWVEIPADRRGIITCPSTDVPEEQETGWVGPQDLPASQGLQVYEYNENPYLSSETDKTLWGTRRWSGRHFGFEVTPTLTEFLPGRTYYVKADESAFFRCSGEGGGHQVSSSSVSSKSDISLAQCAGFTNAFCPQGRECCVAGGMATCRNPDGSSRCDELLNPPSSPPAWPIGDPTQGLILHWSFDNPEDANTPDLNDYSGNERHAERGGFPTPQTRIPTTIPDNQYSINCNDSTYISYDLAREGFNPNGPVNLERDPFEFDGDSQFSVSLWVRTDDVVAGSMFSVYGPAPLPLSFVSQYPRGFFLTTDGTTGYIEAKFIDGLHEYRFRSTARVPRDGAFHSVIMTYNGNLPLDNRVRIFLNGELIPMQSPVYIPHPPSNPVSFMPALNLLPPPNPDYRGYSHISACRGQIWYSGNHLSGKALNGNIDDIRVYNRLITPGHIPGMQ